MVGFDRVFICLLTGQRIRGASMPKLQSQVAFVYKRKKKRDEKGYEKFWITIPQELVKALGWKKGDEIDQEADADTLTLRKRKL